MKIYIAGPMTGLPEFNLPSFWIAEKSLAAEGYSVESPAANQAGDLPYHFYIRRGLAQLVRCDEIALLPGWERSNGAVLEARVAAMCQMGVRIAAPIDAAEGCTWLVLDHEWLGRKVGAL